MPGEVVPGESVVSPCWQSSWHWVRAGRETGELLIADLISPLNVSSGLRGNGYLNVVCVSPDSVPGQRIYLFQLHTDRPMSNTPELGSDCCGSKGHQEPRNQPTINPWGAANCWNG